MILVLEFVLLCILGFFLIYGAMLSLFAVTARLRSNFEYTRDRIFAVVVPAHNEESVIEKTLESLFRMDYRREFFDVIVVADHCTDRTAEIARSVGAIVLERQGELQRGKGHALRWCFEKLLSPSSDYEAIIVIDADSETSKNFLRVMNFYLDRGAQVVQAADIVQPNPGAWSPEVTRVALTLNNYARPLGRKVLGFSAGLRGNGMCFSTDILKRIPWDAYSLTEDLEYGLNLLLHGVSVVFAPEAVVYASMPAEPKNAESQRARWERGRIPLVRRYAGLLLKATVKQRSLRIFDALIDLVTPPFVNILVLVLAMLFLSAVGVWTGTIANGNIILAWCVLGCIAVIQVVAGLVATHADRSQYFALIYFPRYAAWKLFLYGKLAIRGGPKSWIRTTREQESLGAASGKTGT